MTSLIPPVRATLQERYLFNFRMPASVFERLVPVPWLQPQLINNYAVISFCTLQLHHITVAPLPTVAGLSSLSCAYRLAVLDASQPTPTPAVFVPARYTNNPFCAWFTHLGFSAPHPLVHATITKNNEQVALAIRHPDNKSLFRATVQPTMVCHSALFDDARTFAQFIKQGVSSYGMSIRGSRLTKVDLHKTEAAFEPLTVVHWQDAMLDELGAQGVVLDSAFRTAGGQYQWTYHGLTPVEQHQRVQQVA
jgi:hypothetical protein